MPAFGLNPQDPKFDQTQEEGRQICRPSSFVLEPVAWGYPLDNLNVFSLPALGALGDVELNALAFLQGTETVRLDGGVMNEDVLTVFTAQKSKTLGIIEPLDCALFHCCCSSLLIYRERNVEVLRVGGNRNRQELQIEFYDYIECSTDLAIGPNSFEFKEKKAGLRDCVGTVTGEPAHRAGDEVNSMAL